MDQHKHTSSIFIQRVPIFKGNDTELLTGIQALAREYYITEPKSVYILIPNTNDTDCIAFIHVPNKRECYQLVKILQGFSFNNVNIKVSVNKFYKFTEDNVQGFNNVSNINSSVTTTKGVNLISDVDLVDNKRDNRIMELTEQVKKLTCVVAHLFKQQKLIKADMNHMAEALIDHIIPEVSSTSVSEEDEVDELFKEVFGVASKEMI